MSDNKEIQVGDPHVLETLVGQMRACLDLQARMRGVNAYWRRFGTCMGAPGIADELAEAMDNRIALATTQDNRVPYCGYDMRNNNAEIRRLEKRIAELSYSRETGFSGWEFGGGRAEVNTDADRLQLFFDDKPDDRQRAVLKANGFKWAPSQGAWQRQLTGNAICSAGRIDFLKPSDGRTVREHQPKAPSRDGGAR